MRLPSVKTLMRMNIDKDTAKRVRAALERHERSWLDSYAALKEVNDIIGGFGVEYIEKGDGDNSPSIEYVNLGDTYKTTLLWVNRRFDVCDWGYYVERGCYA